MSRLKTGTYMVDSDDMVRFGRLAREKRLNKSSLLRMVIAEFLKRERREARVEAAGA